MTCLGGKLPSHKQSAYAISNAIADYDDGSDCTLCNARVTNYFTILCTKYFDIVGMICTVICNLAVLVGYRCLSRCLDASFSVVEKP